MFALLPFEGPVESNFNLIQSPLVVLCCRTSYLYLKVKKFELLFNFYIQYIFIQDKKKLELRLKVKL